MSVCTPADTLAVTRLLEAGFTDYALRLVEPRTGWPGGFRAMLVSGRVPEALEALRSASAGVVENEAAP
jgi:hypothetical protein